MGVVEARSWESVHLIHPWEPTSTFVRCGTASKVMCSASSSESVPGSTVSSPLSIAPPAPPAPTRHAVSDTKPSRDSACIVSVFVVVDARPVHKGQVYGKPRNAGISHLKARRSLRSVAEERCARKCGNLRVLNSYWVNQDATFKYFEIIMVDVSHKAVRRDPRINWLCAPTMKHRELRGQTSAGRANRGLRNKNHGANKRRPSTRANWKRRQLLSLKRYR